MILLSLLFVFVPFISIPGLLTPTYTQLFPFITGWIYLFHVFKLSLSKRLIIIFLFFLLYISAITFVFQADYSFLSKLKILIAYCFGFVPSLFYCLSQVSVV